MKFKSEIELAKCVISWLQDMKWEVYQEVVVQSGNRCDIVAVRNNIIWCIECKLSLSLKLISQANEFIGYAHYVSIVTPMRATGLAFDVLQWKGIGALKVYDDVDRGILEYCKPFFMRKAKVKNIKEGLCEEQKTYAAAGNNSKSYWSPFKTTEKRIQQYVKQHDGCTLKDILDNVATHYQEISTTRSVIPRWIRQGVIGGIKLINVEGKNRFFYNVDSND